MPSMMCLQRLTTGMNASLGRSTELSKTLFVLDGQYQNIFFTPYDYATDTFKDGPLPKDFDSYFNKDKS